MALLSRVRDRRRIEAEIRGHEYRFLLKEIQYLSSNHAFLHSWDHAWVCLDGRSMDDPLLEAVVRVVAEHSFGADAYRCRTILLRVLWPHLDRVVRRRERWDPDADELWQCMLCCFLETLSRLRSPFASRSLTRTILNRATHRLHDIYRVRWRQLAYEIPSDPEILGEVAGGACDPAFERIDLERVQSLAARRLVTHLQAGRITETDRLILTATRVYGISLRRIADVHGLPYERIKKRLQRKRAKLLRADRLLVPGRREKGPLYK